VVSGGLVVLAGSFVVVGADRTGTVVLLALGLSFGLLFVFFLLLRASVEADAIVFTFLFRAVRMPAADVVCRPWPMRGRRRLSFRWRDHRERPVNVIEGGRTNDWFIAAAHACGMEVANHRDARLGP
jgi:hypothetical protein